MPDEHPPYRVVTRKITRDSPSRRASSSSGSELEEELNALYDKNYRVEHVAATEGHVVVVLHRMGS